LTRRHVRTAALGSCRVLGGLVLAAGLLPLVGQAGASAAPAPRLNLTAARAHRQVSLSPRWIVEGPGDQNALADIQSLDPALAQTYFDNGQTYVLAGDTATSQPPANEVPSGWSAIPTQHYTSFEPCPASTSDCTSFSSDVSSGALAGSGIRAVMFDDENWAKTPADEKTGVCSYMKQFAELAHANGLTSIVAPDQNLASPGVITAFEGGESTDWQAYLRLGLASCAAASGTNLYNIMSQAFETYWCGGQGAACEGSEADFTNFVTQAALQAKAVSPGIGVTAGLSTNPRYNVTPQAMYQDSLNVRHLVPGFWLNVAGSPPDPATALQYLEMRSGLVPFYFGSDQTLSATFPASPESDSLPLSAAGGQTVFVSSTTLPAGTVIPAGAYEFEPFTDGSSGSATIGIEVGYCAAQGCGNRTPIIAPGSWNADVPAGDTGSPVSYTVTSPTTLPAGGPYSLYVAVQVQSGGGFNLLFNSGSASANLAVPRPSSDPAVPQTSVTFAQGGGRLSVSRPATGTPSTLSLASAGNTATFRTRQALAPGAVIPAGAWEFQYWTDGTGSSATLDLQAGYCNDGCTNRVPIIGPSAGWQPTVTAGAEGAASPGGAFTTDSPTVLPSSGGPYHLYWTVTVATPGNFNLRYGSASAPTNLASPLLLPATRDAGQPGRSSGRLAASWPCSTPVAWPTSMRYPSGSRM
jgi:hypothetical protein